MTAKNFVVKNGLTVGNITLSASTGNIVTSNANLGNSVTANYYIGDGGLLSNISLSNVHNGNSNLSVILNSNVTTSVAGVNNVFVVSSNAATINGNIYTNQLNTGLVSGTPSQVYVAAFNGANAYLSYNPAVLTAGGNVTIEAWVYPTTASIIGLFDGGPLQIGTIRNYPANTFSVQGFDYLGADISSNIAPNTWQHIAVTFSSGSINAYVNGSLIDAGTYGPGYSVGTAFNIGSINSGANGYFTGSISNFRVTNKLVYTTNFVPPSLLTTTQAANIVGNPSAGITGTQVSLLTIQNNPIVDNSTFAYSVTNNNVSVALQSASFSSQGSFIYNGNFWQSTSITANGNITANYFTGNGSQLSNVLTVSQYTAGSYSNVIANVHGLTFDTTTGFTVTDLGGGNALIQLGSSFKTWQVAGQTSLVAVGEDTVEFVDGNNIVITTNASATPQQIEFSLSDNITLTGNIVAGGNSNLGNSVTANFFLGDGGLLSNITVSGGTSITNGNSNVIVLANSNVTTSVAGNANIFVVSGTGVTATYYEGDAGGLSNIAVANVSGLGNVALVNFDGNGGNILYGNGVFAPTSSNATSIVNGNSNVIVSANGNVSTSVAGNANVVVVTGTGANINGNLTVTNISNLGNVGNVKITGGANGQILATDGTGNLNWYNKPSGGTGFIYVYTRSSGAIEVQLTNSVLNIVGRSGNIPVSIS